MRGALPFSLLKSVYESVELRPSSNVNQSHHKSGQPLDQSPSESFSP